jgi:predicted glycogen debranching enzyme
MADLIRRMPSPGAESAAMDALLGREWLVTNGLGGYASGTVAGVSTRRYHGLLIAALPAPLGRYMMLNHLSEQLRLSHGRRMRLGGTQFGDQPLPPHGTRALGEFRLEAGLPVWRYVLEGLVLEKLLFFPHLQNTVQVTYRLIQGRGPVTLRLQPSVHFREHQAPVTTPLDHAYMLTARERRYELSAGNRLPSLRLTVHGRRAALTFAPRWMREFLYRTEESLGYDARGALWSPGYFHVQLGKGHDASLVASTEVWDTILALKPEEALAAERQRRQRLLSLAPAAAQAGMPGQLVLAGDQFITTPPGRIEEATRARAGGDEVRTIIAGYHWFTDWGRDTMISLEGLTLATGRHREAGYILRTFGHYVRDGLIPNVFPEGEKEGLYHTADASLWFFHALDRYLQATGDRGTLQLLLPSLREIVDFHIKGTRFGIGVDPADGLLRQGQEKYQLTWMDAKVGDWVVTPRRGKAVEINALWYNALRLLEVWLKEEGVRGQGPGASEKSDQASSSSLSVEQVADHAERARASFNDRFWNATVRYLYDVVDGEGGDDPACRPNQIFAISLPHPVLHRSRWEPVVEVVREKLLTPVGLRSLAPDHPDYKPRYFGDLRARDAAYHQGTVWGWLIGPFVDAWLKLHPEDQGGARRLLAGFADHLGEGGLGSISEVFDAEAPYVPRGCITQAWSVAEVLRAWLKTSNSA